MPDILDEAIAAARRIPQEDGYHRTALHDAGMAMARQRREKDVLRVAALMDHPESAASEFLEQLALAHAAAGAIADALRIVERIRDPGSRVHALAGHVWVNKSVVHYPNQPGVGILQHRAGHKAAARKTLERAAELVASMPEDKRMDKPLAVQARTRAATALACAWACVDEFAAARKAADGIQHNVGKSVALAALVHELARAGRTKEAMADVERLTGAIQVHALMHLGAGQAEAGDRKGAVASFERAHVLLDEVTQKNGRHVLAYALIIIRADAGDFAGAMRTADAFDDESGGLPYIAHKQAETDVAAALKMAAKLSRSRNDFRLFLMLRRIAKEQAQRGGAKAALDWIGRLDAHLERAYALVGVADGIAGTEAAPRPLAPSRGMSASESRGLPTGFASADPAA